MLGIRLAASMVLLASPSLAQSAPDPSSIFPGKWWNERCSTIDLTVTEAAPDQFEVGGTFTTGVGSGVGNSVPITGYVAGDLIAFSAALGATGSLTSWSGQHTLDTGEDVISTQWLLAANLSDDEDEKETLWRSLWTGSDNFKKTKPSDCK